MDLKAKFEAKFNKWQILSNEILVLWTVKDNPIKSVTEDNNTAYRVHIPLSTVVIIYWLRK